MRNGTVDVLNANVTVELLTGETIFICSFEGKTTCSTIWNRVEGELLSRGVVHPHIFGLAIKIGSDWIFVDPEAKVSKYFPKEWRCTSSSNDNKTLVLHCRIHFYLETLPPNFDVVSLLHYYIQLRQNLVTNPKHLTSSNLIQAVAFALQSELGDWRRSSNNQTSSTSASSSSLCSSSATPTPPPPLLPPVTIEFPRWIHSLKLIDYAVLTRAYSALAGLGQNAARIAFIKAMTPQHNMHLYGMTLGRSKDGKDSPAWIGVTPKGIEIYQLQSHSHNGQNEIPEQPRVTFLWANITKLSFERKKFEIRGRNLKCSCGGSTEKLTFTGTSELVPRHLLLLCRSTHQFSLSTAHSKLEQLQQHVNNIKSLSSSTNTMNNGTSNSDSLLHLNNNTTSSSSASSKLMMNNDEKMLDLSLWADGLLLASSTGSESNDHQRVSVISNASSNTTSGIVSDRVYSLDGSEEELDLRETDCCSEHAAHHHHHHTNNSTSLESLSQKPPPPYPRLHNNHLSTHTTTASSIQNGQVVVVGHGHNVDEEVEEEEEEAKYWYCDSDCEDCCEEAAAAEAAASSSSITGSCRSLLVRTIGGKSNVCRANNCECSSCAVEEDDLDGLDLNETTNMTTVHHYHHQHHHHHNSTPSMASEVTLKAIDISSNVDSCSVNTLTSNQINNHTGEKQLKTTTQQPFSKNAHAGEKILNGHSHVDQEHVYGEISEISEPKTDAERQYCTIENSNHHKMPVPKPRHTKSAADENQLLPKAMRQIVEKTACTKQPLHHQRNSDVPNVKLISNSSTKCGKDVVKCKHKNATNGSLPPTPPNKTLAPKESECLTTKLASRKCLRTQRISPSAWIKSSGGHGKEPGCKVKNTGNTGGNGRNGGILTDETDSCSNIVHNSSTSCNFNDIIDETNENLLRQGRYPCTRTVSDNFDTDSDYVQLPPLHPRPILQPPPLHQKKQNGGGNPSKLWKFVTAKTSALNKSCGNLNMMSNSMESTFPPPPIPPHTIKNKNNPNMCTIPRRFSQNLHDDHSLGSNAISKGLVSKVSSRSTTALNSIVGNSDETVKPEPPPRPKKLTPGVELMASLTNVGASNSGSTTKAVDARIISTKPQILIQTAYATTAPIAKPSQAQILSSASQVVVNNVVIPPNARSKSQIISPMNPTGLYHSQSVDNIYDTVAFEGPAPAKARLLPPPPLYPKSNKTKITTTPKAAPMIIRSNNYIDVHAAAAVRHKRALPTPTTANSIMNNTSGVVGGRLNKRPVSVPNSRCGSVPSNLNLNYNFMVGLQNLKPLSRAPIVYPNNTAQGNNANANQTGMKNASSVPITHKNQLTPTTTGLTNTTTGTPNSNINNNNFTTVYTSQLSRSQIQHFKAQLYSDMDYVIFPQKDPRQSQQEYFDSKSVSSFTTASSSITSNPLLNCMNSISNPYSLNDIPPPYLPPPPPYPASAQQQQQHTPSNCSNVLRRASIPITSSSQSQLPSYQDAAAAAASYQSLYNAAMSSNTSQCSSSQYGYYAIRPSQSHHYHPGTPSGSSVMGSHGLNLNAENLQRFLSTQSLMGGNSSNNHLTSTTPTQIYYPASTHSAPPYPPYKDTEQLIIENGMRKAVHKLLASSLTPSGLQDHQERIRLKLCRSDDSLYTQPLHETEQTLQAIYNLPPPPPYKKTPMMPQSDVDLAKLRAKCSAMELPLLKALCSETDLLTQQKQQHILTQQSNKRGGAIRPTAHSHPNPNSKSVVNTTSKDSLNLQVPPARPPKPAKLRQQSTN